MNYSFLVTNTGNVTLHNVTVTDPLAGLSSISCPLTTLSVAPAAGSSMTCTASLAVDQATFDANTSILNTATADSNESDPATSSATVTLTHGPKLTIAKTAAESTFSAVGQTIHYTITATNDGNVALASVTVSDPNVSSLACTPTNGSPLAPGASLSCTATHTITQADLDAGHYANTACADDGEGGAAQACASKNVPANRNPHLSIAKSATESTFSAVGQTIHYTITATNNGNVMLASVTVSDPNVSGLTCTPPNGSSLAPGASLSCTATHTINQADLAAGHYANTACVDDIEGPAAQACASHDVPADLTPHLTITKTSTETSFNAVGQTIHYTITATNDGNVALASVTVSDPSVSGLTCAPPNGSLLNPGASLDCTATHTITQADLDAGHYANTACARTSSGEAVQLDGGGGGLNACASHDVPANRNPHLTITKTSTETAFSAVGDVIHYTITATNDGNVTLASVTVSDPNVSGLTCTPPNGSSLNPGASLSCTAAHTITQVDLDARHYANTACVDDGEEGAVQACASHDVTANPSHLTLIKQTVNGDGSTSFNFDVNSGFKTVSLQPTADGAAGQASSGQFVVPPGAVDVAEMLPANWTLTGASCLAGEAPVAVTLDLAHGKISFNLPAGTNVTCTFVDSFTAPMGSITIRKQAVHGDGKTSFHFSGDLGSINLKPSANGTVSSAKFTKPTGSYTITEASTKGWKLTGITCTGSEAGITQSNASVSISLGSNQDVVCTFTNEKEQPQVGSIVLIVKAIGRDGQFRYTSTIPGKGSFTVTTHDGKSTRSFASLAADTYTITEQALPFGWLLTQLSCTDPSHDTDTDLAKARVTIPLVAGEQVVCTYVHRFDEDGIRERTKTVVLNFVKHRAQLLTEGPDRSRLIRRLPGTLWGDNLDGAPSAGFTNEPVSVTANGDSAAYDVSFATSISQLLQSRQKAAEDRAAKLESSLPGGLSGLGMTGNADMPSRPAGSHPSAAGFDAWVEGHYKHYDDKTVGVATQGHFGIVYVGADYLITPSFLLGVLGEFDWAEEASSADKSKADGTGWMAGPYATLRLMPNLFLDGRVAWGRSDNSVDPFGIYTDNFTTERWLANANLTGNWNFGNFRITPSVGYTYYEEEQAAYIDSNGVNIPSQRISENKLTFGPEVAWRFVGQDGTTFEPHASIMGIWDMNGALETAAPGRVPQGSDLRGKVEIGFLAQSAAGPSMRVNFSYDGIANDYFRSYGGEMWVNVPLD